MQGSAKPDQREAGEDGIRLRPRDCLSVRRSIVAFSTTPESEWSSETFLRMVHDEYIRVARKLVKTGLSPDIGVELTDLPKFFPDADELDDDNPFPLEVLAGLPLSSEVSG